MKVKKVNEENLEYTAAKIYLLIIRCPDATRDLTLQVDLRGPMSLSTDRAD